MFLLLVIVVILHQTYATIHNKLDRWPLRTVYLRIVECIGRTVIMPAIVLYYLSQIPHDESSTGTQGIIAVVLLASGFILCREVFGIHATWKMALRALTEKVNHEDTVLKDMSWVELLVLNTWRFGVFSTSPIYLSRVLMDSKKLDVDFVADVKLRNVAAMQDLSGSGTSTATKSREEGLRNRRDSNSANRDTMAIAMCELPNRSEQPVGNPMTFRQDIEIARSSSFSIRGVSVDSDDET